MMDETQYEMSPPKHPPGIGLAMEDSDYIRDIGDRVADLTIKQARELSRYIEQKQKSS